MFCLRVCLCTTHVPGALGCQKKASDALECELQVVVSCHMSAGSSLRVDRNFILKFNYPSILVPPPPTRKHFIYKYVCFSMVSDAPWGCQQNETKVMGWGQIILLGTRSSSCMLNLRQMAPHLGSLTACETQDNLPSSTFINE